MSVKKSCLISIFVLALLARVIVALTAPVFGFGDDIGYDEYALKFLQEREIIIHGHPSSFRPPLYIWFVAFMYKVFGHNVLIVKIAQAILGSITCLLTYYIGKELISEKAGLISYIISAFFLSLVYISSHLLGETIFTLFLILSILFWARNEKSASFLNQAVIGLSLGLASLTKGTAQLFPLVILSLMMYKWLRKKISLKNVIVQFSIICLCFFIPIIPWTIRNYKLHKAPVLITTETGEAFYSAYHPVDGKRLGFSTRDETKRKWSKIHERSEVEGSKFLIDENLKFIRNNPKQVARLTLIKVAFMWSPFDWEMLRGNGVYNYTYGFIIPFVILGMVLTLKSIKSDWNLSILYLPLLYLQGIGVVFDDSPRYRLPIEPLLIILASAGIIYLYQRFSKKRSLITAGIASFFLLNFCLFLYSQEVKGLVRKGFELIGLW